MARPRAAQSEASRKQAKIGQLTDVSAGLLTAVGVGAWIGATINAASVRDREISQLNLAVARFDVVVARHNAAVTREAQANTQVNHESYVLNAADASLTITLNNTGSDSSACSTVHCVAGASRSTADGLAAFGRTLRATAVPAGSAAIARRLIADTASSEKYWAEIAQADSFVSVENDATAAEKVGGQFDNDYQALMTSLNNAIMTLATQGATLNDAATTLEVPRTFRTGIQ